MKKNSSAHTQRAHILLAVCTYKRPNMLKRCLESICMLSIPDSATIDLYIVQNEANETESKIVFDSLLDTFPNTATYVYEDKKGICYARNKAITEAIHGDYDYLAFLDDDQTCKSDWLEKMLAGLIKYQADAVQSSNIFVTDSGKSTPCWLKNLAYNCDQEAGVLYTCGCLISKRLYKDMNLCFDNSNPNGHSEDARFFQKSLEKGGKHYFLANAITNEVYPDERLTVKYFCNREFSLGISNNTNKTISFSLILLYRILKLFIKLIFSIVTLQKKESFKILGKICNKTGGIYASFGGSSNHYSKVTGD